MQTSASLKLPAAVYFNVIPQNQGAVNMCAGILCYNTPQAQDEGCRLSCLVAKAGIIISGRICRFCQVVDNFANLLYNALLCAIVTRSEIAVVKFA